MQWVGKFLTIIGIGMGFLSPVKPESHGLVTRVEIQGQVEEQSISRQYTKPEKMEAVLDYLRTLKSQEQPKLDPERLDVPSTRITVYSSTGTPKLYLQRGDTWVSKNYGPWRTVPQSKGEKLYELLSMPSDT